MDPTIPSVKSVFDQAWEIRSSTARQTFLDRACAGDAELRRQVEGLLRAYDDAGGFLETPPAVLATVAEGPGTVIGSYRLVEEMGEGGFGVVWLAEQTEPVRRQVALKVIKPGMDTRQWVARFEAERQALALMDHPHIARVLDGGATASGRPYFVMELVRGDPLTEFCDRHRLDVRRRLELFIDVCQAVQHAHQKGVIHRDLKPSNVLVAEQESRPVVKVIDFGIAKAMGQPLTERTLFTGSAQVIGTPLYMSPEQADPVNSDIDTRTDVYSLGVLLYEMLTGTTPLDPGRLSEVGTDEARRILREEDPPRPGTRMTGVPRVDELDWVVMKALEKDRNRRYETASALAADVRRYLDDEPVAACPPSAAYRFGKFARRHRAALTTAALVVVALVAGIVVSTWQALRAGRAEDLAEGRLRTETAERERAEQAEHQALLRLFDSRRMQAEAGQRSGRTGQRFASLAALAEAADLARQLGRGPETFVTLRNQAILSLSLPDLRPDPAAPPLPQDAVGVWIDAAFRAPGPGPQDGLAVHSLADGREVVRLPRPEVPVAAWRQSADGRVLAVRSAGGRKLVLHVWDLGRPEPVLVVQGAWDADLADDGRRAAVRFVDNSVRVYELPGGRETLRLPAKSVRQGGLRLRPGHPQLAVCLPTTDATVGVGLIDLETGREAARLATPEGRTPLTNLTWDAAGRRLACTCKERVVVWEPDAGRPPLVLAGHQNVARALAFHPTRNVLASVGRDQTVRLWDLGSGRQLVVGSTPATWADFSPDGERLVLGRPGPLVFWQADGGQECRALLGHTGSRRLTMDFSPDGRWLASAETDGVRLWDVAAGAEAAFLRPAEMVYAVGFEPDGSLLLHGRAGSERLVVERGGEGVRLAARGRARLPEDFRTRRPLLRYDEKSRYLHRVAVSADGRWQVRTFFGAVAPPQKLRELEEAILLDRRDGTRHRLLEGLKAALSKAEVALSPDSRWLAVSASDRYDLWRLDPPRKVRSLPRAEADPLAGPVAFSPDGLLAVARTLREVTLIDPETFREVATLESPDPDPLTGLCFSEGGMLAAATQSRTIRLWDLRLLRRQLAPLGLDWPSK